MKQLISIIVPCYNEEESITHFHGEIKPILVSMPAYDFEIIYVDDGSKDKTLEMIKALNSDVYHRRYISFSRNFGKEAALIAGLRAAKGDYVCVMDVDMQDPPSFIPLMIDYINNENYDVVGLRRVTRKGEPPIRSWFARKFYKIINKYSETEIVDGARDFRMMKRKVVDAILQVNEYNRFSKGIFSWVGFKTKYLEYENTKRAKGTTKWSFKKLFKYSIDGTIAFSTFPLQFTTFMGLILMFLGFAGGIATLVFALLKFNFSWILTSILSLAVFLTGFISVVLGIQGLYIGKTYEQVKNRPLYILSEKSENEEI